MRRQNRIFILYIMQLKISHPHLKFDNDEIIFLPANTTYILQKIARYI